MIFQTKNMLSSTSPWPTTGKIIWLSNISPSRVNSSSAPFFSSQNELLSTCSRTKSKRTRSSSTSDVFSSWTTVTKSSQSISTLSRVLSIPRIYPSTSLVRLFNNLRFSRLSGRTSSRSALSFLLKLPKTKKTTRPFTSKWVIDRIIKY